MNYKTIKLLSSAFISYKELWRSRRVLSAKAVTPSSISIILHMILSLMQNLLKLTGKGGRIYRNKDLFAELHEIGQILSFQSSILFKMTYC